MNGRTHFITTIGIVTSYITPILIWTPLIWTPFACQVDITITAVITIQTYSAISGIMLPASRTRMIHGTNGIHIQGTILIDKIRCML
jgi:hypothetical protein